MNVQGREIKERVALWPRSLSCSACAPHKGEDMKHVVAVAVFAPLFLAVGCAQKQ